MEKITIEIKTLNAAFSDSPMAEVVRMLREFCAAAENNGGFPTNLRDYNGNTCGKVTVK